MPFDFEILGTQVRLARPDLAWTVVAALFAMGAAVFASYRRRALFDRLGASARLREKLAPGASATTRRAGIVCACVGLLLLSLALLRPQAGEGRQEVKREGIDLVVALDASRSMHARDILPSRLERATLELSHLIDSLQGDRVGIVSFAGEAFVQCPLTSDYGAAKLFLRAIDPESMPSQGTAVAAALDRAAEMFRSADRGAKTRAVLLLTDGEDHEGDVDAAAERLKEQGIRVFALGIGSVVGTPIPRLSADGALEGYLLDSRGETVLTKLHEEPLRQIAATTGGEYVAARSGDLGLGRLRAALDELEKSELDSHSAVKWRERWHLLGFPGFALLLVGALLSDRRALASAALLLSLASPLKARAGIFDRPQPDAEEALRAHTEGRHEEALEAWERAVAKRPDDPAVHFDRGTTLLALGRNEEAAAALLRSLSLQRDPQEAARAHFNLGHAWHALGKDDEAIASFATALQLDPEDEAARRNLEILLRRRQQHQADEQQQEQQSDEQQQEQQEQSEGADSEQEPSEEEQSDDGQQNEQQSEQQQSEDQQGQQGEQAEQGEQPQAGAGEEEDPAEAQPAAGQSEKEEAPEDPSAEKLLDSLREGEKSFQLWRYRKDRGRPGGAEKEW